jgi:hypothetical protein
LPTITSGANRQGGHNLFDGGSQARKKAKALGRYPTPRASDADRGGRGDLLTVLRGYETRHAGTLPTARDTRSGKASDVTHDKNSRPLNEVLSKMSGNKAGHVNPRFLEWMMGYPIGWSERAPSETAYCRKSPN